MVDNSAENEEPFDGVLLENYANTYHELLTRRCFKQKAEILYIIEINNFHTVLCYGCYLFEHLTEGDEVYLYRLIHTTGDYRLVPLQCDRCRQILQDVRPIIECGSCTNFLLPIKNE